MAADLAATPLAEALEPRGFDRTKPALFTCEGILVYLPPVRPNPECSRGFILLGHDITVVPVQWDNRRPGLLLDVLLEAVASKFIGALMMQELMLLSMCSCMVG